MKKDERLYVYLKRTHITPNEKKCMRNLSKYVSVIFYPPVNRNQRVSVMKNLWKNEMIKHTHTQKKSTGTVNREFLVYSSMSLYVHTNKSRTCVEFKWLVWYETLRGEGVWGWYVSPKTIFDFVTCCPATRPTPLLIRGDTNTPAGS